MKIYIDNGHGQFTPGKRSPDDSLREAFYNREIAKRVVSDLKDRGHDAILLVPEGDDISLKERVRRVNTSCLLHGRQNVILVSIHVNAAKSDGKWHDATGWSVYTSKGNTRADALATCLADAAKKALEGKKIRADWSDGDIDIEEDFYILRKTLCAACLPKRERLKVISLPFPSSLPKRERLTVISLLFPSSLPKRERLTVISLPFSSILPKRERLKVISLPFSYIFGVRETNLRRNFRAAVVVK